MRDSDDTRDENHDDFDSSSNCDFNSTRGNSANKNDDSSSNRNSKRDFFQQRVSKEKNLCLISIFVRVRRLN